MLEEEDAVFCNLEISTPDRGEIEIDLVLFLANRGCVVVTFDGINWIQSDTHGKREIFPGQQARRNMFAIRDFIRNRWSQGNLKSDWIVAFPKSHVLDVNDNNLPRHKIVDKSELGNILSNIKSNIDSLNTSAPISKKWIDAAIKHLTAIAAIEVDREKVLEGNLDYVKSLTHERVRLLDQLSGNDRYYVQGPAGSGKTWLAFEQARRWSIQGLRVGIVAFNKGITTYMQNKAHDLELGEKPAWIGTFHNFANLLGTTAGTPGKYDEEKDVYAGSLINAATQIRDELKFDAFVVDVA